MAIFGNKNKNGTLTINFCAVEGTPLYQPLNAISMNLLDDKIEFKYRVGKREPIYLDYAQIRRFGTVSEEEVQQADKSVLGRAVVGGILLGPLGAVVGAIDGTTKKTTTTKTNFFVINYISSAGEEVALPLEIVGATMGLSKIEKELEQRCSNLELAPKVSSNQL